MKAAPTAFTLNEYRSLADLEPVPWGEERASVPGPQDVATEPGDQAKAAKSAINKASRTPYETGVTLSDAEIAQLTKQIDSKELAEKLGPTWRSKMEQIALDQWASLGFAEGSLSLVNPMISTHLAEFGARWVTEIDGTTKSRLARTLSAGAEAGESITALASRIRTQMGDLADGYRARLIARTEVNRSANLGREFSWKATDLPLKKKYISALVKETRKAHAALHGKTIDVDESWKYDGSLEPFQSDTINMPGNSTYAAHSCHCLCTAVAFDPEHGKDIEAPYQSDAHAALCKAYEDETDAWEAETIAAMTPFYRAMEERLVDALNNL